MTSNTHSPGAARRAAAVLDERSVGDLLLDADITARELLWEDSPGEHARARTIGCERVVDAAADLWAAIPDRSGDPTMRQLQTLAQSQERHAVWLAGAEPEAPLAQVHDDLRRATELVAARRHPTAPLSQPGHLDSEAARTRVMHTVHVTTHATASALDSYRRALQWDVGRHGRVPPGESLEVAAHLTARLHRVEYLAASYLHSRWPNALHGQHREQPDATRLTSAVAQWRVDASRALAGDPVATNLALVARVERELAISTLVITDAAARLGASRDPDSALLLSGLGQLQKAWGAVDQDVNPLVDRRTPAAPGLLHAAHELRAALREITHDGAALATASTMAERTDLTRTPHDLHRFLPGAWDVAQGVRESVHDPDLVVRARGAQALVARGQALESTAEAVIDSSALAHNRTIALPDVARTELLAGLERVAHAANAAAALTLPPPAASFAGGPSGHLDGLTHQRREPMRPPPPAPGHGCDR